MNPPSTLPRADRGITVIFRLVGQVAALIALVYVIRVLATNWHSLEGGWRSFFTRGLAIAFPAAASALLLLAWTWHWLLGQLGVNVAVLEAFHAWFTGNLYKYIPGQVWLAVGRTAKGAQAGVPARATLGTTALEQGYSVLVAALVLGIAQGWPLLAVASAAAQAALAYPPVANMLLSLLGRLSRRPLPLVPLRSRHLLFLNLVSFVALGLGALAMAGVMLGLGVFRLAQLPAYLAAFTGSFLSGFFFFGAPAGLGVREGTLLVLLDRAGVGAAEASLVAVVTRTVAVLTDLACFLATSVLARARIRRVAVEP